MKKLTPANLAELAEMEWNGSTTIEAASKLECSIRSIYRAKEGQAYSIIRKIVWKELYAASREPASKAPAMITPHRRKKRKR